MPHHLYTRQRENVELRPSGQAARHTTDWQRESPKCKILPGCKNCRFACSAASHSLNLKTIRHSEACSSKLDTFSEVRCVTRTHKFRGKWAQLFWDPLADLHHLRYMFLEFAQDEKPPVVDGVQTAIQAGAHQLERFGSDLAALQCFDGRGYRLILVHAASKC
eukprot:CAMPEP_0177444736 /NCGR_PEP_ID=MMETSP0369-20130122/6163_1 /TAXON_ID=447022 ORGANISM="Scrippsiella hangoei-like, Strain SHHI-4" /NCGR_SAMPLE_ID=MMETSP0369 /ASSEMBLY_ACC=CAM_ASM_000364 /LENGTH=162 /DNA_ID=CAMNT_0018916821 /DNA_START=95 /DNA_END=583 /DNA_ORIENTATION=+